MYFMFWVWLGVLVLTAVLEFATQEVVSIWFTVGAIVPLILAGTGVVSWEWQVLIFLVVSVALILSLRRLTKKFLLRNANYRTNVDSLIGKECRMLSRTDFETRGSVKINDVVWTVVAANDVAIEKDEIVRIVKVDGNKLIVERVKEV